MKHLKRFNEDTSEYVGNNQSDYSVTITIPQTIINICKKHNIDEEQYETLFENYMAHLIGDIYGSEAEQFGRWCEESDNISDYQYPEGYGPNGFGHNEDEGDGLWFHRDP